MPDVKSTSLVTSLATNPDITQTYFDKLLLTRAEYYSYHSRWATARPLKQKTGKNVVFRRYTHINPAISALVEGVPPAGQIPPLTDFTAVLSQFGDVIATTDFAEMTQTDPFLNEFYEILGEQAGYSVDMIYRDVAVSGTGNVIFANGTSRANISSILDNNDLDRIQRSLIAVGARMMIDGAGPTSMNSNMMPVLPGFPVVIHPFIYNDLQNISGFLSVEKYKTSGGMMPGECGRYRNLVFFLAPDPDSLGGGAKVVSGAGAASTSVDNKAGLANVYLTLAFGREGFTIVPLDGTSTRTITKGRTEGGPANPLEQVGTMGWITSLTSLRTNENWLGRIESAASL